MGKTAAALFIALYLVKIDLLGITGAGLLTLGQLALLGVSDEWLSRREYARDSR